jgi:hypothetical protein
MCSDDDTYGCCAIFGILLIAAALILAIVMPHYFL